MKSLMLATFNVSLFFGACMWAMRGPDVGVVWLLSELADKLRDSREAILTAGAVLITPLLFLACLIALPIVMFRLGRHPYTAYHLTGCSLAALISVMFWFAGFVQAATISARFVLPLGISTIAMFAEIGYRRLPSPYWVLAGVGLVQASAYATFIIGICAAGRSP